MTKTSNTTFSKNGECGHPSLFPDLSGNTFSFLPLGMMLADHLTCLWETYMQVRKQQLELDMEQQTGSK